MSNARELAELAGSYGTGGFVGMKNRIINGAMMISQRGASPTITGGGDYSLDRFGSYYTGGAFTSVQSTTAPAGFINSMLFTVSTAGTPTYSFFYQRIEGLNCADLGFGLSTASTVTLSFWVRSSVTGIFSVALGNDAGNRAYASQYTINSANTWEQKTITVPGDTSGTWLTNNAVGIGVRWNLGTNSGSRLISAGSWQAVNADGATGSTGATAWANTSGATFYITGVQLEKGSTATSFDYRPYGAELALCQRYYWQRNSESSYASVGSGMMRSSTLTRINLNFPTTMRAAPTFSFTNIGNMILSAGASDLTMSSTLQYTNTTGVMLDITTSAGTSGAGAVLLFSPTSSSIQATAEL